MRKSVRGAVLQTKTRGRIMRMPICRAIKGMLWVHAVTRLAILDRAREALK